MYIDKTYIDRPCGSKTVAGTKMIWYDHYSTVCVHCILHVQEFIVVHYGPWILLIVKFL